MEFKGPKTYTPSFAGKPSPSRDEMWKDELGFEKENSDGSLSPVTSDEEPEVDQLANNASMVELQSLQIEIQQKDKQREELLLKLKVLSDKTANYKARLSKSEQNKKSHMQIMKKTHELFLEQKDKLIYELREILSDHEKALVVPQGVKGKKKGKANKDTTLPGINRLVDSITTLHEEKAKLAEAVLVAQSELEVAREEAMDSASKYRNQISDLQVEIKRLKLISKQDAGKENINIPFRVTRLEEENKRLRQERKKLESEMWMTQESLRDEVCRLEDELKATSKKMRDAETKYVNLAATPPKVQVRTVQVVSEETKQKLDEALIQNGKLQDLLSKMNIEHSLKIKELDAKISTMKEKSRTDIKRILNEKKNEIQRVKLEAERTSGGLKKLYQSLQENCLNLMKETQELRNHQRVLSAAAEQFSSSLRPIFHETHKQIIGKIASINQENKDLERRYVKEMKLRKQLHNELVDLKGNIRVYCRVRPFVSEDRVGGLSENSVITFDCADDSVLFVTNKGNVKNFEMEKVFQPKSTQEQVFSEVRELVVSCLDGYNICIFAYGQTGSGKTFTMEGTADNPGLNQRALRYLFKTIEERSRDWTYTVKVNVLEIYNESIRDLLSSEQTQRLEMKLGSDGVNHVRGLTDVTVDNIDHVNQLFSLGKKNRATAITNMNEHSSRSHAILRITVSGAHNASGNRVTGKLNLVDLAGSERVNKSGSEGMRMKEAQNINKSLSCLGDVIHALKNKHAHVPYRNSKLTFLLRESLGGDSKTLMVVQVSPAHKNVAETLCSLNFAQRVRMVELGQATKTIETAEQKLTTPSKAKRNETQRR